MCKRGGKWTGDDDDSEGGDLIGGGGESGCGDLISGGSKATGICTGQ